MKVLLTGRNGQVGWELERALPVLGDVIATDRAMLDLADREAIRRVVRATRPDVIVNAAAYTAVDRAEGEPTLARKINAEAPEVLSAEAKRCGALMVQYSTDYVFDGTSGSPYHEDALPKPVNVYGTTKLEGERAVVASGCRYLLLRTSWVYAPRGRNFFLAIATKAKEGLPLRVVADQTGVPSEARFVAESTVSLIATHAEGIVHVVPSGATTWHGFALAIVERSGAAVPVQAIRSSEYRAAARRPSYSVLENGKLQRCLGGIPSWEWFLERCARQYWRVRGGSTG